MSSFVPVNGAPMTITLGIDDKSIKRRVFERAPRAIHTPLVFLWAEYGPLDCQLMYGNTFPLTYGDNTLDLRGKFANHATPYATLFLSNANPMMVKRLVPRDIGPKASLRISVEVLEEELDEYERELDGSFKRDSNFDLVKTGATVPGHIFKFITSVVGEDPTTGESLFNKGNITTGTMVNKAGQPSKIYPLLDFEAPHLGSKGNNYGIRIWAPTQRDRNPLRSSLLEKDGCYPFRVSLVSRIDEYSSSKIVDTIYGEKFDDFTLKPGMVDTDYNKNRFINDVVINGYQDLNPFEGEPLRFGPFGEMAAYTDNIEYILRAILSTESTQNYAGNDLFGRSNAPDSEDFYRVNLFGLQQPDGAPYQTARFDTSGNGVRFTERTDNFMDGASDGTMTDAEFARLVEDELDSFGDPNSPYQDIIQYPCSFFWDSGFPMSTKYKMGKFISQRKNTNVSIATYIAGEPPLTSSEESARHLAIVERIRSFAESDYFATPTVRASIVSRSGQPLASSYRGRLPCNYELANMVSRLAAGQSFKAAYLFDRVPYNNFELLGDVKSLWVPSAIRNKDWAMGMMWPERITQRKVYFPANRTVYKEDTSVLTSILAAIICAECETVGILCHKQFSGGLFTKAQLKGLVEDYCHENLQYRFAELVRIEPICYFTDADNNRGYSWSLVIKVHLPMMRTVQTLHIEAYDLDDIAADSPAFVS